MAKIEVDVGVKTGRFKAGLDAMRSQAASFSATLGKMGVAAMGLGKQFLGGVKNQFLEDADAAREFAAQVNAYSATLGEATSDLQAMAYAAEIEKSNLDELVKGLLNANKAAKKAAEGSVEAASGMDAVTEALDGVSPSKAAELFRVLQMDPKAFSNASFAEQIIGLADAFEKLSQKGDPTLQFLELFGTKAKGIISMLKGGAGGLAETMSKAPIISAEAMKQLEELEDKATAAQFEGRAKAAGGAPGLEGIKQAVKSGFRLDKAAALDALKGIKGETGKSIDGSTEGDRSKARNRLLSDGDPFAKLQELRKKEEDLRKEAWEARPDRDFAVEAQTAKLSAEGARLRAQELIKNGADPNSAGPTRERITMFEQRALARELEQKIPTRSVVASSLQEVGGGGRGVIFGGADQAIRQQANDVAAIRAMISSLSPGRQPTNTRTPSFERKR